MEPTSNIKIRNSIRKVIRESIFQNSGMSRDEEIIKHIEKCLNEFSNELKEVALNNDHPYVRIYLETAIYDLKKDISKGSQVISGIDEMLLNPDMKI